MPTQSDGSPPSDGGLRRLKVAGVGLPILFFLAIEAIRLSTSGGIGFHSLLLLFIVVAVIAFSFVMFHFIERAQAQVRESERQAAILAERERIARELHDSLAQVLGATHLRLRALGASDEAHGAPSLAFALDELADICEEGYRDARGAILDLRESSQADRDLLEGLRAYLDKYSHQCGIEASLETNLDHDLALPPRSEIQIIRVIQEALTNVRKHSGAASATVSISQVNGSVRFVVEDNGRGFDLAEVSPDRDGFGLHSMRQRMELIGGTLLTDSASGRGTRIVAEAPTAARADYDRPVDASTG